MYLNYYKHTNPQPTQTELENEYKKNKGIIRTIEIPKENYEYNVRIRNNLQCNINLRRTEIRNNSNLERAIMYRKFYIRKQNGGMRTIEAPTDIVKDAQRKILDKLTKDLKILPHDAAHGCVKNRNCKTALERHQANNSKWFLKIDFSNAFSSIHYTELRDMLNKTALTQLTPAYLKNLLVCIYGHSNTGAISDEGLPQGSPLSPFMLNMYMVEFDYKLTAYCREHNLVYTRYVDDLLISGYEKFNKDETLAFIASIVPEGMSINQNKTRFGSVNWKNWNLGLMYNNEGNLTVGYRAKKLMKNKIHNYNSSENRDVSVYQQITALLNYYKYIEPEYFSKPKFTLEEPNAHFNF